MLRVLLFQTSFTQTPPSNILQQMHPAIEIVKKDGMIQESGLGQHWCSIAQAKADPTRRRWVVHQGADPQRRVGDASEILPEYEPY